MIGVIELFSTISVTAIISTLIGVFNAIKSETKGA